MAGTISVILPTFNRADLIAETLDTLLAQTRAPKEILVVDDGSTDHTSNVVAAYGEWLTYLAKPNGGKASALNLALEKITADYVWIVDDDDLLEPDAAERLAGALDADPELDFCAGKHIDFRDIAWLGLRETSEPGYWRASTPEEVFPDLLEGCHIFQPGLMVRREVYADVGPFREDLTRSQDYEMILRIARHHRGRVLDALVFRHREHAGLRGSSNERFSAAQNVARWAAFNRRIFEPLLANFKPEEILTPAQREALAPDRLQRLSRLKLACIAARQKMWPEAIAAWRGVALADDGPLSPEETELVRRATYSALGSEELFADKLVREDAMELRTVSPLGREIVRLLARSVRWQAKRALMHGDLATALAVARFSLAAR